MAGAALASVAAVPALTVQAPPALAATSGPPSFADLAERLIPSVVNVSTTQMVNGAAGQEEEVPMPQFPPGSPFEDFFKDFFDRQRRGGDQAQRRVTSLGSGFVIDAAAGLIVTNNHVIADAEEITVTFHDGTKLTAELKGHDPKTDLALLKVTPTKPLVGVEWGDSDRGRVGDWVLAIGNPFGLGGSVTAGIISARNRDINAGPYDDFIQTDASINRGNSGGPMFNAEGKVIGINTAIFSPTGGSVGIGFAIPSSIARQVVAQLAEFGETRRGWLGVRIQSVTDEIAESLGLDGARGALVAGISEEGPAVAAGIEAGDVILTFDNKPIEDMRSLPRIVAETPIGKTVDVKIWRGGKEQTVQVQVGQLDETEEEAAAAAQETPAAPARGLEVLGMTLAGLTPELRTKFEVAEDVKGVVVTEVKPDSAAAEKGIRAGDVIVEVAQKEVGVPADVGAKIDEVQKGDRKSVLLLLNRAGDLRFVALRLDPKN
ncbi:DegQ family serine endoprotease [Zavarzinia sp. CC-PAN008]|uniref:DegQ family serine endoprotease n=1 Tax=Zavarzinia sp. CC-PAN008 TaxID=3243332 RepID=UPI003F744EF1